MTKADKKRVESAMKRAGMPENVREKLLVLADDLTRWRPLPNGAKFRFPVEFALAAIEEWRRRQPRKKKAMA